jgi:hypothetical protein
MIGPVANSSVSLEAAGAALMRKQSLVSVGRHLVATGQDLQLLSEALLALGGQDSEGDQQTLMAQRCQYAAGWQGSLAQRRAPRNGALVST